jgi:hypothetical protein
VAGFFQLTEKRGLRSIASRQNNYGRASRSRMNQPVYGEILENQSVKACDNAITVCFIRDDEYLMVVASSQMRRKNDQRNETWKRL